MERFFDQWVYHGGYPEVEVSYDWNAKKARAEVVVKQKQKVDALTPLFTFSTSLVFGGEDGETVEAVTISEAEHTFHVPLEARPAYVRFDPAGDVLMALTFKKPKAMLLAQLAGDKTLAGRYDAIGQLGKLDSDEAVAAIAARLHDGEAFWGERARAAGVLAAMDNDTVARHLLREANAEDDRVRLAVVQGLSKLDNRTCEDTLLVAVRDDAHPGVVAAAISGLAKLRCERAVKPIEASLARDSHNETIRNAALRALAELDAAASLDAMMQFMREGQPRFARRTAIGAVARLGAALEEKDAVAKALIGLLESGSGRTRVSALDGLGTLGAEETLPEIRAFIHTSKVENEVKRAEAAIRKIEEARSQPAAVKALRGEVKDLEEELKSLLEKVEKLEALVEKE